MRFITVQDLPTRQVRDSDGKVQVENALFNQVTVPVNSSLGFRPMFAIPITTYKETMARMLLCAVNYPRLFCVFDTDDYVRIDKVKYYQMIKDGTTQGIRNTNYPIADDSLPDYLTEYVLNIESLPLSPKLVGMVEAIKGIRNGDSVLSKCVNLMNKNEFQDDSYFVAIINEYLEKMPEIGNSQVESFRKLGMHNIDARMKLTSAWLDYSYTIMPLIVWTLAKDTRSKTLDSGQIAIDLRVLESVMHNLYQLSLNANDMQKWSVDDCSLTGFKALYEHECELICDSMSVLDAWFFRDEIGRNDKCPCGSGRKYKKCHGKY